METETSCILNNWPETTNKCQFIHKRRPTGYRVNILKFMALFKKKIVTACIYLCKYKFIHV